MLVETAVRIWDLAHRFPVLRAGLLKGAHLMFRLVLQDKSGGSRGTGRYQLKNQPANCLWVDAPRSTVNGSRAKTISGSRLSCAGRRKVRSPKTAILRAVSALRQLRKRRGLFVEQIVPLARAENTNVQKPSTDPRRYDFGIESRLNRSECPTKGKRRIIGVEITGIGGTHKRCLSVLVVIPSGLCGEVVANVDCDVGQRLVVVVFE